MDILKLFHKDLSTFSKKDLITLARYYHIPIKGEYIEEIAKKQARLYKRGNMKSLYDYIQELKNNSITELKLSEYTLETKDIENLANVLSNNTSLKILDLSYNKIGDIGALHLATSLRYNTTLQKLNLTRNDITDNGATYLGNALKYNTGLQALNLTRNDITDGVKKLAEGLFNNTSLKILDLSYNKIGDIGALHLANSLLTNTSLQSLLLGYTRIGDIGAEYLANALSHNTSLKQLYLYFTSIREKGAEILINSLGHNSSIQQLILYDKSYNKQKRINEKILNVSKTIDELFIKYNTRSVIMTARRNKLITTEQMNQLLEMINTDTNQNIVEEIQPLPNNFHECSNSIDLITHESWKDLYDENAVIDPIMLNVYDSNNNIIRKECAERANILYDINNNQLIRETLNHVQIFPIKGEITYYITMNTLNNLANGNMNYSLLPIGEYEYTFVGGRTVQGKTIVYNVQ